MWQRSYGREWGVSQGEGGWYSRSLVPSMLPTMGHGTLDKVILSVFLFLNLWDQISKVISKNCFASNSR